MYAVMPVLDPLISHYWLLHAPVPPYAPDY